jgi:hypothetical protein
LFVSFDDRRLILSSLECIISGNPLPDCLWLFNDRKILVNNDYERKSEQLNSYTVRHQLIISPKTKKLGVYKAQAQNTFGHTISTCQVKKSTHSIDRQKKAAFEESELQVPPPVVQRRRSSVTPANIETVQKPMIVQDLNMLQADIGSPCALTCKSKYDTEQQWTKDGQIIVGTTSIDGNVFVKTERSQDGNTHVLNIKRFEQENSGNYELILKNNIGIVNSCARIDVKGIPPTFTLTPKATAAVKGTTAEFNCRVTGSPKPEVCLFTCVIIDVIVLFGILRTSRCNGFSMIDCYVPMIEYRLSMNVASLFFVLITLATTMQASLNVSSKIHSLKFSTTHNWI